MVVVIGRCPSLALLWFALSPLVLVAPVYAVFLGQSVQPHLGPHQHLEASQRGAARSHLEATHCPFICPLLQIDFPLVQDSASWLRYYLDSPGASAPPPSFMLPPMETSAPSWVLNECTGKMLLLPLALRYHSSFPARMGYSMKPFACQNFQTRSRHQPTHQALKGRLLHSLLESVNSPGAWNVSGSQVSTHSAREQCTLSSLLAKSHLHKGVSRILFTWLCWEWKVFHFLF